MFMRVVYDEMLAQATYVVGCQRTGEAVVIDPQRDVDRYVDLAASHGLRIVAAAETHIHADFLSGARELAETVGAAVYVSDEGGDDWAYEWLDSKTGGGSYDYQRLQHGETFWIGKIEFEVIHTPGHTPEHVSFLVTDFGSGADKPIGLFSGDFVFVGDLGRPDLLETAAGQAGAMRPSARALFQSLETLNDIPDFTQVWPGHGSGSACGKSLGAVPSSTIGYERRFNPAIKAAEQGEDAFIDFILKGQPEPPLYFATMKLENKRGPRVLRGLTIPPRVTAQTLAGVDAGNDFIADTRAWDAFRAAHLPGALSFPLTQSFATDVGSMIAHESDVWLVVDSTRLEETVRKLVRIGIDNIKGWCSPGDLDAWFEAGNASATIKEVDAATASVMIEDAGGRVLDVRRGSEFDEGHLPGAVNIAHTRLAVRLDDVPSGTGSDAPLLVNCRSGARSARACAYLARQGREVVNLRGGYIAWSQRETGNAEIVADEPAKASQPADETPA
ncbi:MAG: rhodanese-like domain-containing protein [Planctomycetota bacterium]